MKISFVIVSAITYHNIKTILPMYSKVKSRTVDLSAAPRARRQLPNTNAKRGVVRAWARSRRRGNRRPSPKVTPAVLSTFQSTHEADRLEVDSANLTGSSKGT
jgi:hypothetical protein